MARRTRARPPESDPPAAPAPTPPALLGVDAVRRNRLRGRGDPSMKGEMDRGLRELAKLRREVGQCADAWAASVPPSLLGRTRLVGLSRGVLTVAVTDAAARYALDRALRSGAERAFLTACAAAVRKVKLVMAEPSRGAGRSGRPGEEDAEVG